MLTRIGSSGDVIAGEMRFYDVAGSKVCVAKSKGHLYAFDDTCTHLGCSLAKGKLEGTTVTCPCNAASLT